MNVVLTLLAVATGILLIVIVLRAMKHKRMNEFQAVAWLVGAVGIIILGIFPQIIPWVAGLLDVWWPPAVLIFSCWCSCFLLYSIMLNPSQP